MKLLMLSLVLLAFPVAGIAADSPVEHPVDLPDADKIFGLAHIWQEVNYSFVYFDQVPHLNWDSTFLACIPQVLATESTFEYYRVLQRFIALLEDGHTSVTMPRHYYDSLDRPKIGLQEIQERIYITNVDTSLKQAGLIGSEIVAVDGIPTREYMMTRVFPYFASSTMYNKWYSCGFRMLMGWHDTDVEITCVTPDRDTVTWSFVRNRDGLEWYPPIEWDQNLCTFKWLDNTIAYVALNSFADERIVDSFATHLPELLQARAVVIDLRQNGGGSTGIGGAILSHFTHDTLTGSTWRTREHRGAFKAWESWRKDAPRDERKYFFGDAWYYGDPFKLPPADNQIVECPVAVLVSHNTGSAAEDFLILADSLKQFTLVGERSNGSTGQPIVWDLPGGGTFRICTKRDTYPDGRDFVGVGVIPDILVEPTPEDAFADRDVVLERALEWLEGALVGELE